MANNQIKTVNDIDTSTVEGKLLLASLAMITTAVHTDKTPDQILDTLNRLSTKMFTEKI